MLAFPARKHHLVYIYLLISSIDYPVTVTNLMNGAIGFKTLIVYSVMEYLNRTETGLGGPRGKRKQPFELSFPTKTVKSSNNGI